MKTPPHIDKRPGVILLADKKFMRGFYKAMATEKKKKTEIKFRRMG